MALWVFFFSVQTSWFVYQYKTTRREIIPGPERKKNEVAFQWWILAVCFIRTPIEGWIDHSDKLALLRLQIQAFSRQCCQCPTFCQIKCKYRKIGFFLHFVCMLHWNLFLICLHVSAERWLNPLLLNFEGYDVSVNLLLIWKIDYDMISRIH